jgi:large subunit ribosomal protein L29
MKTAEIRELTSKEIQERIDAEKSTLVRMKLNHVVSPLDNPLKITHIRKDIARLKTILAQKSLTNQK